MTERDRDELGRARSARPRDETGRPLPRGATGADQVADDVRLSPLESVREAQRLLDGGRPFQAHEVLEQAWKAAEPPYRDMWQGLAQIMVGLTHVQRGNVTGAAALLRRGSERIAAFTGAAPYELDLVGLHGHAVALAERIDSAGLVGLSAADVRPTLRAPGPGPAHRSQR